MATSGSSIPEKSAHYFLQLQLARTAGDFSADIAFPARDVHNNTLSWSELFRKVDKHCIGEEWKDLREVVSAVRKLAVAIEGSKDNESLGTYKIDVGRSQLVRGDERVGDIRSTYEGLKAKNDASDVRTFALAWYACALEDPAAALAHINKHAQSTTAWIVDTIPLPSSPPASAQPSAPLNSDEPHLRAHRAWAFTEVLRTVAVKGISFERLGNPDEALQAYTSAIPVLTLVENEVVVLAQFREHQDLWRWTVILLWRATMLSQGDKDWLERYERCSAGWWAADAGNWMVREREAVCVVYLRSKLPGWRRIVSEYRAILDVTTSFPRAGQRNTRVEEFVEMCVAVWERVGGTWISDILWWATRLTFNSYLVLRYLVRALHDQQDYQLARRTLELYVAVVDKAWEVSQKEGVDEMHPDADTDEKYVETLAFGVRMLCRMGTKKDAQLAEKLVGQILRRAPKPTSSIKLAQAISEVTLATTLYEYTKLATAHGLFLDAVDLDDSSWIAHWYLSVSYARYAPDPCLDAAQVHAAKAVDLEPKDVRCWHLLALVSAAKEDWPAASVALDMGQNLGEIEDQPEDLHFKPTFSFGTLPTAMTPVGSALRDVDRTSNAFLDALQIRMSQVALAERIHGTESAVELLPDVFSWAAKHKRKEQASSENGPPEIVLPTHQKETDGQSVVLPMPPVDITVLPSTPIDAEGKSSFSPQGPDGGRTLQPTARKRAASSSSMLSTQTGRSSRKMSVSRALEWDAGSKEMDGYSSIHSRSKVDIDLAVELPSTLPNAFPVETEKSRSSTSSLGAERARARRETRGLSELWLMSAAMFRRLGKLQQCLSAIQEAESMDARNGDVWVQLGLYHHARSAPILAADAFKKALVINSDDVAATVWLSRVWIEDAEKRKDSATPKAYSNAPDVDGLMEERTSEAQDLADLAVGQLEALVHERGWDSPEAWWLLARAYRLQSVTREKQARGALAKALELTQRRGCGAIRTLDHVFV
ncbi:hypothetical protein CYLTODRAFT_423141 [Cylindrobasidium torrendii FP15055 ss-10]|uniref:Uncharacterized protein n=1 Tax=Cylindrobasidium torrendii FP15055 ss-10 TaxID=1314674 RepID=A0A0D7B870_9AGAR|nr:hypothetical protein CYLTODRAFT_423141 [Cylindrobasidium torrendii FP15055 ss-10]